MKKVIWGILIFLLIFLSFLLIRTLLYAPDKLEKVEKFSIDFREGHIERFQEGIQIPTISRVNGHDTMAFIRFQKYLEKQFPLVLEKLAYDTIGLYSYIFKWDGTNSDLKPALFLAHSDVVPIQEENLWKHDPFSGIIEDGYIHGRGAIDNKCAYIGILEAAETLLEQGIAPERSIYFAFGHDEELGGEDGAIQMVKVFEEEGIEFEYIIDEGLVVVTEGLPGITKPIALIGLSEKGSLSLTLKVQLDNGGHTMMPPKETAISILSSAIDKLSSRKQKIQLNECVDQMFDELGPHMKWPEKLVFANQWLFRPMIIKQLEQNNTSNALIKTTYAPTIIKGGIQDNILPSTAEAVVNARIAPGETVESVIEYVRETINDERVELISEAINKPRNPTFVSPTDHVGYESIERSVLGVFGDVYVAPGLVIGGTDSRHYGGLTKASYRFMPVQLDNQELKGIHGVNERISIDNYERTIAFYASLIQQRIY